MKRHYRPDLGKVYLHDVRPETAGWKYLSFKVVALAAGLELTGNSGDEEIVLVPLVGRGRISFNAVNDPHYEWVAKQWDGNPLEIPVRTDG